MSNDKKKCLDCGASNDEKANFCILCGSDLTQIIAEERPKEIRCPSCQAVVVKEAKFCHHCGSSISIKEVAAEKTTLKNSSTTTQNRTSWMTVTLTLFGFVAAGFLLTSLAMNENDSVKPVTKQAATSADEHNHPTMTADPATLKKIDDLTAQLNSTKAPSEKKQITDDLSKIYLSLGRYKDAAQLFITYLPNEPKNEQLLLNIANLLDDSGEKNEAISYYKKVIDLNPKNVDARVDLATAMIQTDTPMNAITELTKALEIDPNHQIANLNLGIMNYTIGRYDKAKEFFQKAQSINPSSEAGKRADEGLSAVESMNNKQQTNNK